MCLQEHVACTCAKSRCVTRACAGVGAIGAGRPSACPPVVPALANALALAPAVSAVSDPAKNTSLATNDLALSDRQYRVLTNYRLTVSRIQ